MQQNRNNILTQISEQVRQTPKYYLEEDDKRMCIMCKEEWETLEHIRQSPEIQEEERSIEEVEEVLDDGSGRE